MPMHVLLATWTDQGVRSAMESVSRSENVARLAERLGGRIDLLLRTQRRYDLVGVVDLPGDQAFATLALQIGATGMARTVSLRGFTADEFGTIVQQLDTGTTDRDGFSDNLGS